MYNIKYEGGGACFVKGGGGYNKWGYCGGGLIMTGAVGME